MCRKDLGQNHDHKSCTTWSTYRYVSQISIWTSKTEMSFGFSVKPPAKWALCLKIRTSRPSQLVQTQTCDSSPRTQGSYRRLRLGIFSESSSGTQLHFGAKSPIFSQTPLEVPNFVFCRGQFRQGSFWAGVFFEPTLEMPKHKCRGQLQTPISGVFFFLRGANSAGRRKIGRRRRLGQPTPARPSRPPHGPHTAPTRPLAFKAPVPAPTHWSAAPAPGRSCRGRRPAAVSGASARVRRERWRSKNRGVKTERRGEKRTPFLAAVDFECFKRSFP